MKKLVFMFVAVAAISCASCGNQAQNAPANADTAAIAEIDTTANDSTAAADSTAAPADSTQAAK